MPTRRAGGASGAPSASSAAAPAWWARSRVGVFPTRSFLDQRPDVGATKERLDVLREQNEALSERIEALSTPEEIERLAREQYNLVHPGEEAYAVLPGAAAAAVAAAVWPFGPLGGPRQTSRRPTSE